MLTKTCSCYAPALPVPSPGLQRLASNPRRQPCSSPAYVRQRSSRLKVSSIARDTVIQHQPVSSNGTNGSVSSNGNGHQQHSHTYHKIQEAVSFIQSRTSLVPDAAIVLGSGLGSIAKEITEPVVIRYADIPNFHAPGVVGHPGQLIVGRLSGMPVVAFQGRFHYYEGHSMEEVVLPIRVAKFLGAHTAILTNAAGAINFNYQLGDLMLIEDHLNLMTANPLRGPNHPELGGPRFLDLSEPYNKQHIDMLQHLGEQLQLSTIRTGVYAAVSGPTYETRAETRMLRAIGADAVGMSTVPEVIAARHMGMTVVGISCITNLACGISPQKVSHEDVVINSALGTEKLKMLLLRAVPMMCGVPSQ